MSDNCPVCGRPSSEPAPNSMSIACGLSHHNDCPWPAYPQHPECACICHVWRNKEN